MTSEDTLHSAIPSRRRASGRRAGVLVTMLATGLWAAAGAARTRDRPRPTGAQSSRRPAVAAATGWPTPTPTAAFGPNLDRLQPTVAAVERQVRVGGSGMPPTKTS